MADSQTILKEVHKKITALQSVCRLSDWRFALANPGKNMETEDSANWKDVNLSYSWSSAGGDAWFGRSVQLPAEVLGLDTTGHTLELVVFCPIGATVYVNGQEVYSEPFWSDTRAVPIVIAEAYRPEKPLDVRIRAKQGDGFGLFVQAELIMQPLSDSLFSLEASAEQLRFCQYIIDREEAEGMPSARRGPFDEAVAIYDLAALAENNWERWHKSVQQAVAKLMSFDQDIQKYTAYLVGHSHIDMNWLWPWEETVEVCRRDFTAMDSLMEKYPDFRFSQSQAAVYAAVEQHHPDLFDRIKERVETGQWDITASTWVEGDLNTAMGETLVRQILYTRAYIREKFGVTPRVCWEPDTFGHPAVMPQILKKCGVDFYYFCRAGKGYPVFWWESPDGSRILAFNDASGYNGEIWPTNVGSSCRLLSDASDLNMGLWVYGVGDHGGGATARDIERGQAINRMPLLPKTKPSSVHEFFDRLTDEVLHFPVVKDELNTIFEGCYTSHGDIKRLNRSGEMLLLTGETIAAQAALDADAAYPQQELADAWKNQCFHQFHDILCGCSIGLTYREAAETLKPSHETLRALTGEALQCWAERVEIAGDAPGIVVYNQLAWSRTEPVRVSTSLLADPDCKSVVDSQGRCFPVQKVDDALVFIAHDVPALGCEVYHPSSSEAAESSTSLKVEDTRGILLENEFLAARIHPDSGSIHSLKLKPSGHDLLTDGRSLDPVGRENSGLINRFMVYWERPHPMSAWNIGDISRIDSLVAGAQVELIDSGPVCARVRVKHTFLQSSLEQDIVLYAGVNKLDFVTVIDWHEKGGAEVDAPMLKVTFTPKLQRSQAVYETPFGVTERTADGSEVPALRWASISDGQYGLSLLNDCKYGHHAQGSTLALTLVRASYEPDNNPDAGLHPVTYSLCPHEGDWFSNLTHRRGIEHNQPLLTVVEDAHYGTIHPHEAGLDELPESIVVSAVKFSETGGDPRSLIIRLSEVCGQAVTAKLNLRWRVQTACEVNMLEEEQQPLASNEDGIELGFSPYEVKTIRVSLLGTQEKEGKSIETAK